MVFQLGQATEVTSAQVATLSSAFRKIGRPVVLVPLQATPHAGHLALVAAARRIPGGVVIVVLPPEVPAEALGAVDALYRPTEAPITQVSVPQDLEDITADLTRLVALTGAVRPSDVVLGEKDYELLAAYQRAATDLHLGVKVHGVPTVRMPDGLAISARNAAVPAAERERATALSAALTAGAHAAGRGGAAVLEVATSVLAAAGVTPEYLELRSLRFGPAPEVGDARLLVAANLGGVRLIDNVGLPVGVGFENVGYPR